MTAIFYTLIAQAFSIGVLLGLIGWGAYFVQQSKLDLFYSRKEVADLRERLMKCHGHVDKLDFVIRNAPDISEFVKNDLDELKKISGREE